MEIIQAANLKLAIRKTQILTPLTFSVDEGEFISFIGPSGCGKTTLLNIIAGIQKGFEGSLTVSAKRISFVFQHDTLLEWQTVMGNVLLPFTLSNAPVTEEIRERARHILHLVGLGGHETYFPHQLSGGMKKRVEIARALVTEPELLILDEPFSSLDIITRERLNLLVKRLHSLRKTTIILVTHSVEESCFLSQRIYVLSPFPARIIEIKTIEPVRSYSGPEGPALFVLNSAQQEINSQIRNEAKQLWDTESGPASADDRTAAEAGPEYPGTPAFFRREKGGFSPRFISFFRKHWASMLIPLELVLLYSFLGMIKRYFAIPDIIFPEPQAILIKFFATLKDGSIFRDLELTVIESLSGFSLAFGISMIVGFIIAKSKTASRLFMPYFIGANTIPSVALAPFLVLWFGFGILPRIVTSVIVIFFPLLINIIAAFKHSEERVRSLIKFYKPGKIRSLLAMEFPAALPGIFSGIKISITLSVIGAVVGEFVSGHEGLGALVSRAKTNFDVELMFVGLVWLILLGLFYYAFASALYYGIQKRLETPRSRRGAKRYGPFQPALKR
jgi:NitT/TauT family transport system ATP-binding protein